MNKKWLSATLLYGFLTFLQPLTSFFLLPIYLEFFPPAEYGMLNLLNNFTNLLGLTGSLGITGAFLTFFYDYHHNEERLRKFLGQILSFTLYTTIPLFIILLGLGSFLFDWIFKSDAILYYPYGVLATATGLLMCVEAPFHIYLRNKKDLLKYALIILGSFVLTVFFQLLLIVVFKWGIIGALTGRLIGVGFSALLVIFLSRKQLTWKLDWRYLKKPLRFVKYFLPSSLARWFYKLGDRFIIEHFMTLAAVGIYSLLSTLTQASEMAYYALRTAILPYLSEAYVLEKEARKQSLSQLYLFYMSLTTLAIFGIIMVVANLHLMVKNPQYLEIQNYVNIFALGYLFSSFAHLLYYEFYFYKDSRTVLIYTLSSVALMVLFNVWWLPIYKLWGAVMASFVSRLIILAALFAFHQSMFAPFKNKKIVLLFLFSILLIAISEFLVKQMDYPFSILSIVQFVLIFLLVLLLYGGKLARPKV